MKKIHLVMPMGGKGSRFLNCGFDFPKPLIEIEGKPFFYWSTVSISKFIDVANIIFVVLQEHMDKYQIDEEIHKYFPEAKIHVIPEVLNGAVLTCMEGTKEIEDDLPVLFNDCDHMFRSLAFEHFIESPQQIDGALLTFFSDEPKYSYLKFDSEDNVIGTVEKQVISNHAICGCYYFRSKEIFIDSAQKYLQACQYSEFFMSGVYNIMADNNLTIKAFKTDFHVPFGVPEEYEQAIHTSYFQELLG